MKASQQSGATNQSAEAPRLPRAGGFSLGHILGVQVQVDWSLLIIFALIVFNLGAGVFPRWHPSWGIWLNWTTALLAAVLFFASVLIHELSHAWVGRAQGIPIRRITLFLFGGVAHMEGAPSKPMAELLMAIVGPLTSIAIGVLAMWLGSYLSADLLAASSTTLAAEQLGRTLQSLGPLATLLLWLGPINIILGLFNLIPGFPLDGGRVLRALLWAITGKIEKATRWASGVGQLFAWVLMGIGVFDVFSGFVAQGLWLVLIGWFLNNAARMSYQQLLAKKALEDVSVMRVMNTHLARVPPDMSVEAFVVDCLMASDQHAFPVESEDGSLLGLISSDNVRHVSRSEWPRTSVGSVMTPTAALATLPKDAAAERAFEELVQKDVEQIPVLEGDHLLGLVRRRDLMRWLALQGGPRDAPA